MSAFSNSGHSDRGKTQRDDSPLTATSGRREYPVSLQGFEADSNRAWPRRRDRIAYQFLTGRFATARLHSVRQEEATRAESNHAAWSIAASLSRLCRRPRGPAQRPRRRAPPRLAVRQPRRIQSDRNGPACSARFQGGRWKHSTWTGCVQRSS